MPELATTTENERILRRLKRRHPIWKRNAELWGEINDVVHDGVRTNLDRYLPRTRAETQSDYDNRKAFARFKGEVSTHVQRLVGAVTRQQPKRPSKWKDKYGDFMSNVDGCGTSLDDHVEDQLGESMSFGAAFAILDRPTIDSTAGQIATTTSKGFEEDEERRDILPSDLIAHSVSIRQIVDWSTDDCGEANWIRTHEMVRLALTPDMDPEEVELYTEWDRKSWRRFVVHNVEGTAVVVPQGEGDHNLGIVPIAILWLFKAHQPWSFESLIRYAYNCDIEAFQSEADRRYNSWKHVQGTLNDDRQTASKHTVVTGPNAVNKMDQGEKGPHYINAPVGVVEAHKGNAEDARGAAKRILGIDPLGGSDDSASFQASGKARAMSFSVSEERILRRSAKAIERYEKRIFEIAERWDSPADDIPASDQLNVESSTWPTQFNMLAVGDKIEHWQVTRQDINSETYDREAQKEIVSMVLGTTRPDVMQEIDEEIDDNPLIGKADPTAVGLEEPDLDRTPIDASAAMRELDDLTGDDLEEDDDAA